MLLFLATSFDVITSSGIIVVCRGRSRAATDISDHHREASGCHGNRRVSAWHGDVIVVVLRTGSGGSAEPWGGESHREAA